MLRPKRNRRSSVLDWTSRSITAGWRIGRGHRRRQNIAHGNLAESDATDHNGHCLPFEINLARTVALRPGIGKRFHLCSARLMIQYAGIRPRA